MGPLYRQFGEQIVNITKMIHVHISCTYITHMLPKRRRFGRHSKKTQKLSLSPLASPKSEIIIQPRPSLSLLRQFAGSPQRRRPPSPSSFPHLRPSPPLPSPLAAYRLSLYITISNQSETHRRSHRSPDPRQRPPTPQPTSPSPEISGVRRLSLAVDLRRKQLKKKNQMGAGGGRQRLRRGGWVLSWFRRRN